MFVYVLTCNFIDVDGGTFDTTVIGTFKTIELAQRMLKLEMKKARKDFKDYDAKEDTFVEGDMSWSIWEDGEYASHHCDLAISEQLILDDIIE